MKTKKSTFRGYKIERSKAGFRFCDTGELTVDTWQDRPCGHCGKFNTPQGHDACLGELPGVMNACCGHGNDNESYIQFENGVTVRKFKKDK